MLQDRCLLVMQSSESCGTYKDQLCLPASFSRPGGQGTFGMALDTGFPLCKLVVGLAAPPAQH